jgi:prolyl oligopeptidase
MSFRRAIAFAIMIPTVAAAQGSGPLKYPDSRRADTTETLHGRAVADPYRWLEDPNSAETKSWIEAQNRVTFGYLEDIPARAAIKDRLTKL